MKQEKLAVYLEKYHDTLLEEWFELLIKSYPEESVKYFEKHKNAFTNPVGSNIYMAMDHILRELAGERDADKIYTELQMILKIRAVQDMKASQAVSFIMAFKPLLAKVLDKEIKHGEITGSDLEDFYGYVDTIALLGLDIYVESRELIYKLRIEQIKQTNDILEKANLLNEKVDTSTFMRCSNYIEKEGE